MISILLKFGIFLDPFLLCGRRLWRLLRALHRRGGLVFFSHPAFQSDCIPLKGESLFGQILERQRRDDDDDDSECDEKSRRSLRKEEKNG